MFSKNAWGYSIFIKLKEPGVGGGVGGTAHFTVLILRSNVAWKQHLYWLLQ